MKTIKFGQYTFDISVSTLPIEDKNNCNFSKIKYRRQTLTFTDFINRIEDGYSFCYCFNDNGRVFGQSEKRIDNFHHTNFIVFDVDHCGANIHEYLNRLPYKPTLAYTTTNDSKLDHRFRLIYFLDFTIMKSDSFYCIRHNPRSVRRVEESNIKTPVFPFLNGFQCLRSGGASDNFAIRHDLAQNFRQIPERKRLVVNNNKSHRNFPPSLPDNGVSLSGFGIRIVTLVPFPGVLIVSTLPFTSSSTRRRTFAIPICGVSSSRREEPLSNPTPSSSTITS